MEDSESWFYLEMERREEEYAASANIIGSV